LTLTSVHICKTVRRIFSYQVSTDRITWDFQIQLLEFIGDLSAKRCSRKSPDHSILCQSARHLKRSLSMIAKRNRPKCGFGNRYRQPSLFGRAQNHNFRGEGGPKIENGGVKHGKQIDQSFRARFSRSWSTGSNTIGCV
jgi:hypothetical protein